MGALRVKTLYAQVQRFTGASDGGMMCGFTDANKLQGVWDNYQCKHYDHALHPGDVWPEIGKLLWYTFNQQFAVPRRYYFVAPRGVGTSLNGYLSNAPELKKALIEGWDKNCKTKITTTKEIPLVGKFLAYVVSLTSRSLTPRRLCSLLKTISCAHVMLRNSAGDYPLDRSPVLLPRRLPLLRAAMWSSFSKPTRSIPSNPSLTPMA